MVRRSLLCHNGLSHLFSFPITCPFQSPSGRSNTAASYRTFPRAATRVSSTTPSSPTRYTSSCRFTVLLDVVGDYLQRVAYSRSQSSSTESIPCSSASLSNTAPGYPITWPNPSRFGAPRRGLHPWRRSCSTVDYGQVPGGPTHHRAHHHGRTFVERAGAESGPSYRRTRRFLAGSPSPPPPSPHTPPSG